MSWKVIGHEGAAAYLKEQCNEQKTRHAYLLTGPAGVGRRTLALAFVKALNCQNPPAKNEYCDHCVACRQIENEAWPDLTVLRPAEGSRELRIDQVRAMQQSMVLAPYQSQWRVIIIPDFQNATIAASNALLKSLEEPPARAILILTADAKENLLETIASRCNILRLRPLGVPQCAEVLQNQFGLGADQAKHLAHLSSGRIGTAIHYAQDEDLLDQYETSLIQLLDVLPESKRGRIQYVETLTKRKGSLRQIIADLLTVWITFWRDLLIAQSESDIPIVNLAHEALIKTLASQLELTQIEAALKAHEKGLELLDANVNPRLIIENILLKTPCLKV